MTGTSVMLPSSSVPAEHRHTVDHAPMTLGVVIQVPGEPPAPPDGNLRSDHLDGLSPEAAGPYDNELPPCRGRHGTDMAGLELVNADVTTDTTCFCSDGVI